MDEATAALPTRCPACGAAVPDGFAPRLINLPEPHASLLELLVRMRGNVKDVQRELGLSYPTVRARLEEAYAAAQPLLAGQSPRAEPISLAVARRAAVLNALERGEITALQAVERLTGDRPAAGTPERRTLVVQVTEAGEPVVNSRISLRLAPVAKRFLPRQAKHYLNAYDIDLEALLKEAGNFDQTRGATPSRWASVFRTLANTPGEGTLVHVEDGETVVRVAVE